MSAKVVEAADSLLSRPAFSEAGDFGISDTSFTTIVFIVFFASDIRCQFAVPTLGRRAQRENSALVFTGLTGGLQSQAGCQIMVNSAIPD